ncbi:MAG: hypothetical protein MZV64_11985 [Ignavibacteriales bacterium]|nr:hypothetical protein [Ignavibacteriales bacterium]
MVKVFATTVEHGVLVAGKMTSRIREFNMPAFLFCCRPGCPSAGTS